MTTKNLYRLNSALTVTFKTADFEALSFSLNIKSFIKCASYVLFFFFLFALGTLLFFKEIEKNRVLEERLLQLQITSLVKSPTQIPVQTKKTEIIEVTSVPRKITTDEPVDSSLSSPYISPRIQEFVTDCQDGICNVQLSLIPSKTGIAQGELLIVLEAEVPRIGTSVASSNIRKRFFIYPGMDSRDELTDDQLTTLIKKPYRFARALQTSAEFSIGNVLQPIATNLYLYDSQNKLIQHERKLIETGEPDAQ